MAKLEKPSNLTKYLWASGGEAVEPTDDKKLQGGLLKFHRSSLRTGFAIVTKELSRILYRRVFPIGMIQHSIKRTSHMYKMKTGRSIELHRLIRVSILSLTKEKTGLSHLTSTTYWTTKPTKPRPTQNLKQLQSLISMG